MRATNCLATCRPYCSLVLPRRCIIFIQAWLRERRKIYDPSLMPTLVNEPSLACSSKS